MTHLRYADAQLATVHGREYRWSPHLAGGLLEVYSFVDEVWHTSAFNVYVIAAHRGEPLLCSDDDRSRAEALVSAFPTHGDL